MKIQSVPDGTSTNRSNNTFGASVTRAVLGIAGGMVIISSVSGVNAAETDPQSRGFGFRLERILSVVAEQFNLDRGAVEDVITNEATLMRQERQDRRTVELENGLNKAVSDGVITESQKTLILEKHTAQQAEREAEWNNRSDTPPNLHNMTREERQAMRNERRAERQEHRAEMQQWAESNGIDLERLREYIGLPGNGTPANGPGNGTGTGHPIGAGNGPGL